MQLAMIVIRTMYSNGLKSGELRITKCSIQQTVATNILMRIFLYLRYYFYIRTIHRTVSPETLGFVFSFSLFVHFCAVR